MIKRSMGMGVAGRLRVALVALCTLMACSTGDGDSVDAPSEVSVEVGEQGGTLKVKGATLAIPEGALDEPVVLTAKNRGKSAQPPAKVQKQVSDLVEFGPDGTVFKKDVELTFDLDEESPKAKVFFSREDDPNKFDALPTENKGKKVTAKVKHFSRGFVAIPADDDGADAGAYDAGEEEAGALADGGADDAGTAQPRDAQEQPPDASAGPVEAGVAEAGVGLDATAPDAGRADAGAVDSAGPDGAAQAGARITVNSRDGLGALVNQTWAAYQDGDGVWQRLLPSKPGVYEFTVLSGRYGVAFVCADQTNANSDGSLHYYTASTVTLDIKALGTACATGALPAYQIQGNLVLPANHSFYRYGHYDLGGAIQSTNSTWLISAFPGNVVQDLVLGASIDQSTGLSSVIVFRDLMITQPSMRDADFIKTGTAVGPTYTTTLDNASASTNLETYYVTASNATMGLPLRQSATISPAGTTRSMTFAAFPASLARPTDAYVVRGSENLTNTTRMITQRFSTPNNFSLALPTSMSGVLSFVKTPYYRPSAMFGDYVGATRYVLSWISTPTAGVRRSFETHIDPTWFAGTGAHTVTFPDFSGTAGFDSIWVLPTNATSQIVTMDMQAHVSYATAEGNVATRATAFSSMPLN